jgi:hypothetical protein
MSSAETKLILAARIHPCWNVVRKELTIVENVLGRHVTAAKIARL